MSSFSLAHASVEILMAVADEAGVKLMSYQCYFGGAYL
jgi:hypothetical protein